MDSISKPEVVLQKLPAACQTTQGLMHSSSEDSTILHRKRTKTGQVLVTKHKPYDTPTFIHFTVY